MPVQEIPLPVGAKGLIPNLPTVTRSGEDGSIPVAMLLTGDNFYGESLEGHWKKWEYNASSVSVISVSGGTLTIESGGQSINYAAITSDAAIPVLQDVYMDIHLEIPSAPSSGTVYAVFYVTPDTDPIPVTPTTGDTYLALWIQRTSTTTSYAVQKTVDGSSTLIKAVTTMTNNEGTFRLKLRPDDEEISVYFKDGAGSITESTDEVTLTDDSMDMILEDILHPKIFYSHETTSSYSIKSDGFTVYVPDFTLAYDQDADDYGKGDVKVFDTQGSVTESDWSRVYNEEHVFVGDMVIQNGLVRMQIDEGASVGLLFSYYTGSTWANSLTHVIPNIDAPAITYFSYPYLLGITTVNRDTCEVRIRLSNSADKYPSTYLDVTMTMSRGKFHVDFTHDGLVPATELFWRFYRQTPRFRFDYLGDDDLADDDMVLSASNTTLTDNFMVIFDESGTYDVMGIMFTNQKPNGSVKSFHSNEGDYISIKYISNVDLEATTVSIGYLPFTDATLFFLEGESMSGTGSDVVDATASGGYTYQMNAQAEYGQYSYPAVLPAGRYRFIVRAKDSNQVADDLIMNVYNTTDSEYVNEENEDATFTLTASYAYYSIVFDVPDDDSGDSFRFYVEKSTATANTISVDYFAVIPLGNGNDFPQDVAHNALREATVNFRLTDSATYQLFSGLGLTGQLAGSVYTDAMAVAAIETAASISLSGPLTASTIKTGADNEGIYIGAGDDFRAYHDGTDTYLQNQNGQLILKSIGDDIVLEAADVFVDISGEFYIRDTDDSDVVLFKLDSSVGTRGLWIGQAADLLPTIIYGSLDVTEELQIDTIPHATSDPDSFLCEVGGEVRYRTGAELASDIGAGVSGTQYAIPYFDTTTSLDDSMISQNSGETTVTVTGSTWVELQVVATANFAGIYAFTTDTTSNGAMFMLGKNAGGDVAWLIAERNAGTTVLDRLEIVTDTTGSGADGRIVMKPTETTSCTFNPDGTVTLAVVNAGVSDYDKFLVSDGGIIKYRTGAQVASDIGAATVPLALTDLASYTQGSIIIGGGSDWEALVAGTEDYVLKMGAAEPAWGQVDYSELVGTQPAPVAHVLASATHTVSGLNAGDILSADSATTYSWKANPAPTLPIALVDIASYARGSLIIGGSSDWEALAKGTANQVLTSDGTDISWQDPTSSGVGGSGTIGTIPIWVTTTTTLGDSVITYSGGTITVAGAFTSTGLVTGDGFVPEGDLVDALGSASLTFLDIFVQNIKDDDGTICAATQSDGSFLIKELNTDSVDVDVSCAAVACVNTYGGDDKTNGDCTITGNGVKYFWLDNMMPPLTMAGGTFYIEEFYFYYYTSGGTGYFDDIKIQQQTGYQSWSDVFATDGTSQPGYGTSTNGTYSKTGITFTCTPGARYRLVLNVVNSFTKTMTIFGFRIKGKYT